MEEVVIVDEGVLVGMSIGLSVWVWLFGHSGIAGRGKVGLNKKS